MDVKVNSTDLFNALKFMKASDRPTLPVLAGVKLTATDDSMDIETYTYHEYRRETIHATVKEPGSQVVSAKALTDVMKSWITDVATDLHVSKFTLYIESGYSRVELPTMPLEDYPRAPQPAEDESWPIALVNAAEFAAGVREVEHAASRDTTLPDWNGVALSVSKSEHLRLLASDRYRVADTSVTVNKWETDPKGFYDTYTAIETADIKSLAKAFKTGDVLIGRFLTRKNIHETRWLSMLQGTRVAYVRTMMPNDFLVERLPKLIDVTDFKPVFTADRRDLLKALQQIKKAPGVNKALFTVADGAVTLSKQDPELGSFTTNVPNAEVVSDAVFQINPDMMGPDLKAARTAEVTIEFDGKRKLRVASDHLFVLATLESNF